MALGAGSVVDQDDKIVVGTPATSVVGGFKDWAILSDARYKVNVEEDENALEFILALEPKTYTFNKTKLMMEQFEMVNELRANATSDSLSGDQAFMLLEQDRKAFQAKMVEAAKKQSEKTETGLLAQQIEEAMAAAEYNHFSGLFKPEKETGTYSVAYASFVVPLIGAVQEQQSQLNEKDELIDQLMDRLTKLESQVNALDAGSNAEDSNDELSGLKESANSSNVKVYPNPNEGRFTYEFELNEAGLTTISLYNQNGALVKELAHTEMPAGQHQATEELQDVNAGTYFLIVAQGEHKWVKQLIVR